LHSDLRAWLGFIVVSLVLEKKNAKVYLENFFTSIPLVETLVKENIYSVSTMCADRLGESADKLVGETELFIPNIYLELNLTSWNLKHLSQYYL
jgi:hypothetical protein